MNQHQQLSFGCRWPIKAYRAFSTKFHLFKASSYEWKVKLFIQLSKQLDAIFDDTFWNQVFPRLTGPVTVTVAFRMISSNHKDCNNAPCLATNSTTKDSSNRKRSMAALAQKQTYWAMVVIDAQRLVGVDLFKLWNNPQHQTMFDCTWFMASNVIMMDPWKSAKVKHRICNHRYCPPDPKLTKATRTIHKIRPGTISAREVKCRNIRPPDHITRIYIKLA